MKLSSLSTLGDHRSRCPASAHATSRTSQALLPAHHFFFWVGGTPLFQITIPGKPEVWTRCSFWTEDILTSPTVQASGIMFSLHWCWLGVSVRVSGEQKHNSQREFTLRLCSGAGDLKMHGREGGARGRHWARQLRQRPWAGLGEDREAMEIRKRISEQPWDRSLAKYARTSRAHQLLQY